MAKDPIRPTDDEAREMARVLLHQARFAACATLDAAGGPMLSRISFALGTDHAPISLVSTLAAHTQAVLARPQVALMVGEPGDRGDPLSHPRLSLQGTASLLPNGTEAHAEMAAQYLRSHPKAKLYIGFADFHFLRFHITEGFLNGGFGKAFRLTPEDLAQPASS